MKKGKAVGIGVAIISVAVVFGIASLPDEVLLESTLAETSKNLPSSDSQINIPTEEISTIVPKPEPVAEVMEEPVPEVMEPEPEVIEEPAPEVIEPEPEVIEEPAPVDAETAEEGKTISINLKDGVGGSER